MGRAINDKALILIFPILFGVIAALPILSLVASSLNAESLAAITDRAIVKPITNSLIISFCTSAMSTGLGTALAFLLTKTNLPFGRVFKLLLLLPLFPPPYIFAVAWSDLFFTVGFQGIFDSITGVILILTITYTPVALFIVSGSLSNINRSVEEAGVLMKNYGRVFLKIVLPFIRPALFTSFVLIFVLTISEFSVPSYLSVSVLTTQIFTQFSAFYNYPSAIGQSIILIAISLLLILPEQNFLRKGTFWSFGKKGFQMKIIELKSVWLSLILCVAYLVIAELLPLGNLVTQAFDKGLSNLANAARLLLPEIFNSIGLSLVGALLLVLFGYGFALLTFKNRWRSADLTSLSIFAVPSTVVGIGLIRFFNTPALGLVYGSSMIILIAFLARFTFVSQRVLSSSLRQIPESYNEAAMVMGVPSFQRFLKIKLPLLSEGLFSSFCICFLFCLSEIGASILIHPPGTSLLPIKVFTFMTNSSEALISAMNVVVLGVTLMAITILFLIRRFLFNTSWR